MTFRDLTMTAVHADLLRRECTVTGPLEGACQVLCSIAQLDDDPWSLSGHPDPELRLMVHRVEPLPSSRVRRRHASVSWDMDCYIHLLRKAREEDLHPGICHSHPESGASFSRQDDENEAHLRDLLQRRNRNKSQVLVSVLLLGNGQIHARVWRADGTPQVIPVRVLGSTLSEFSPPTDPAEPAADSAFLQRQALSIGPETVTRLQSLRVGVVGCGGTGSAVATLLTRAGIGRLLLIDPDSVAETNLNRLHGSKRLDANTRRPKVTVLKDHIDEMGLGTQVAVSRTALADRPVARLLRSCDIVFGCTDDHLGRLILNRLAYFYYIPVIDTGLSVVPRSSTRTARVSGRVTVLRPGVACLLCRGVVNPRRAREQGLRHSRPDEYNRQVKEGYITDSDTPTPVVGTFTTETATAAVNELLAGIAGLRGDKGWATERTIRYDLDRCRPTGCLPRSGCPVCSEPNLWGLGDVQPFLDLSTL